MEYTQEMKDLITKFRAEWKKHDDERDEGLPTINSCELLNSE